MRKIAAFLFCCLLCVGVSARAAEFDSFILQYLQVQPSQKAVGVDMALAVPADNEIENFLRNGAILKFLISFDVVQKRALLPNKDISRYEVASYVRYDPLTRQFMALREATPALRTLNFQMILEHLMQDIQLKFPAALEHGKEYTLRINVSLSQDNMAQWVKKSVIFMTKDVVQPAEFEQIFSF